MDRRKPLQSSPYEKVADELLGNVVERWHGARLNMKERVADVLTISGSGISDQEYGYALQAHIDFVICRYDAERIRDIPQFAVEFDGSQHDTDPQQIERDQLKDAICEQLDFPLVRARAPALQRVGDKALLEWLAELWFVYHDLYLGPADEDDDSEDDERKRRRPRFFNYASIWQDMFGGTDTERYGIDGPFDPFASLRREFMRFVYAYKRIAMYEAFVGQDDRGRTQGVVLLDLRGDGYLAGRGRCRLQNFIPSPLLPETIAQDLALVEIVEQIRAFEAGELHPITKEDAKRVTVGLRQLQLLYLPAMSDDDMYQVMLSWLGPDASEHVRRKAWRHAHIKRHEPDEDDW
jgi:hypothetical protein